jgi:cobalt/nickel transport protein
LAVPSFRFLRFPLCLLPLFVFAGMAQAHFGMIIPSKSRVTSAKDAEIQLSLKFWHPFENVGMNLDKPMSFQVFHDGKREDLLPSLREAAEQGMTTWRGGYTPRKPGLYSFVMEPAPHYEKEEDRFILHLTKVCVEAFGDDDGWDFPLGVQAEIVPLSRPGALYAGNLFRGRVLTGGKPAPGVKVEAEWYPGPNLRGNAPSPSMVTQTVKTDEAGIFVFSSPWAGWWGFAALQDADYTLPYEGKEKKVELGAVLWVYFDTGLPPAPLSGKKRKK